MTEKAVAKKAGDNVVPMNVGMLEEYAGAGAEDATAEDMMIPFIRIIQATSPQVKKTKPEYNPDAEVGMFINTATGELTDGETGLSFVPVYYKRSWTEWVPVNDGGGFVGEHPDDSILDQTTRVEGRDVLPNGHEILTSAHWYALVMGKNGVEQAVIAMSSTQMKKARKLMTQLKQKTFTDSAGNTKPLPLFAHIVTLTSVPESNDKGDWYGFNIDDIEPLTDQVLFEQAGAMWKGLKAGAIKAAPPSRDGASETNTSEELDDDLPF